jgi:hypothetical protein
MLIETDEEEVIKVKDPYSRHLPRAGKPRQYDLYMEHQLDHVHLITDHYEDGNLD